MKYIGEHLLPGQFGQFFIVLSLVSSIVACLAYWKSARTEGLNESAGWKKIGRIAYSLNAISVFAIFAIIYYIISNHYFEYYYAWNHSDRSLSPKFLLSSIWEGQEGSFILWAFWHGVLGFIVMATAKRWEAPVMSVLSFAQFALSTMVIGLYIFGIKIGSNPFLLLRETDLITASSTPFLFEASGNLRADYLRFIYEGDGAGLNQLLQNYWMVIHPPVLFLGFAATIIPFAYAIGGLITKDYTGWLKQALPWSLFAGVALATGIMMGAKWAYESLSFGGYWAWDPVENASFVPWLILVAGIHTQIIFRSTGHSLRITYFFYILQFILILYSTYLTRSGDLQDTSVHAFTNLGMNWQLRIFVIIFLLPAFYLFIKNYKKIPHLQKEEETYSREFWMFIGSLVLFLSALFIILFTSLPVINKIFGTSFTVGSDVEFFYNRIQVFVAIVLGILTAVTQFLKYKNTSRAYFAKKMAAPLLISIIISLMISLFGDIHYDKYGLGFLAAIHLALFASVFAVFGNLFYIINGLKGKLLASGASIAHIGFGLFLVGVLISSAGKEVLSHNRVNPLNFGEENKEKGTENLTMFQGVRIDMGDYWATYVKDTSNHLGNIMYFHILMESKDGKESFTLYPDLIKNTKGQEGFSNNPDAKHYWNRDIFSYITYADKMTTGEDTAQFRTHEVKPGDTIYYSAGYIRLDTVSINPNDERHAFTAKDTALRAELTVQSIEGSKFKAYPLYYLKDNKINYELDTVISQGLAIGFSRIIDPGTIEISVKESAKLTPFIALKVLKFPMINLVWIGTLIMLAGFLISMFYRLKLLKR